MTANEARARLNLPRIADDPTADQLAAQQGGPANAFDTPPPADAEPTPPTTALAAVPRLTLTEDVDADAA